MYISFFFKFKYHFLCFYDSVRCFLPRLVAAIAGGGDHVIAVTVDFQACIEDGTVS